jgi:hypothetical protein
MPDKNSVIAMFHQHTQAEEAVKALQKNGFDMKKLSIVGKGQSDSLHFGRFGSQCTHNWRTASGARLN